MLADLRPADIDADVLRQAVADGEREGIRFECKQRVGTDDAAKVEWALDVTSFANTGGGVLLVGADEDDGRLARLVGIASDVDAELQRLDAVLRDRVDPAIPGLHLEAIDVDSSTVIVVSIPRSWRAPHLVRRGSRWQIARRNSSGKHVLQDAGEVRAAFAEASDAGTRARRWHEDQLAAAFASELPIPRSRDAFALLTVRPLAAGAQGAVPVLDVHSALSRDPHRHLMPLYTTGRGPTPTVDGLLASSNSDKNTGFVVMHRDASLTYYDDEMFKKEEGVPGTVAVRAIVSATERSARAIEWAGGSLPAVLELSLYGVKGWKLHTRTSTASFEPYIFDRDLIRLPAVLLDRVPPDQQDAADLIRPLLDAIWNSVGVSKCEYFTDDGTWDAN